MDPKGYDLSQGIWQESGWKEVCAPGPAPSFPLRLPKQVLTITCQGIAIGGVHGIPGSALFCHIQDVSKRPAK